MTVVRWWTTEVVVTAKYEGMYAPTRSEVKREENGHEEKMRRFTFGTWLTGTAIGWWSLGGTGPLSVPGGEGVQGLS